MKDNKTLSKVLIGDPTPQEFEDAVTGLIHDLHVKFGADLNDTIEISKGGFSHTVIKVELIKKKP